MFGLTADNLSLCPAAPWFPWVTSMSSVPFELGNIQKQKCFLPNNLFAERDIHPYKEHKSA